jgi:hypothetical protein
MRTRVPEHFDDIGHGISRAWDKKNAPCEARDVPRAASRPESSINARTATFVPGAGSTARRAALACGEVETTFVKRDEL